MGSHSLLQGILTQGSDLGLPPCRWILYHLSYQGGPQRQGGKMKSLDYLKRTNLNVDLFKIYMIILTC